MELSDRDVAKYLTENGVAISGRFKPPKSIIAETPCSIADLKIDRHLTIGAYSYIGRNSEIRSGEIGRFCSIGRNVVMSPAEHPTQFVTTHPVAFNKKSYFRGDPYFAAIMQGGGGAREARIFIGHDVWIGEGAFLRAGVTIGTGAIIAARAVVVRDVDPYSIVGGTPAKLIRYRFEPKIREGLLASEWWTKDIRSVSALLREPIRFIEALAERTMPQLEVGRLELTEVAPGKFTAK